MYKIMVKLTYKNMLNITIIIHTRNEEKNIGDCINSAKLLTNKIILIDMESTDKTVEIARNLKVPVFSFPKSNYVEPAREFGIKQATADWVLILDADERMTNELAEEIKNVIFVGNDPRVVPGRERETGIAGVQRNAPTVG